MSATKPQRAWVERMRKAERCVRCGGPLPCRCQWKTYTRETSEKQRAAWLRKRDRLDNSLSIALSRGINVLRARDVRELLSCEDPEAETISDGCTCSLTDSPCAACRAKLSLFEEAFTGV